MIHSLQEELVDWHGSYTPGSTSQGYKLKQEHLQAILRTNQGKALKSLGERRLAVGHDLKGIPFHIEVDTDLVERMLGELEIAATTIGNGDWNVQGILAEEAQAVSYTHLTLPTTPYV